jgi:hypothetical protein
MRAFAVIALLLITSCTQLRVPFLGYKPVDPGRLSMGESASFHFFPNNARASANIALQAGKDYAIQFALLSNWADGKIDTNETGNPLDAMGFADSLMPVESYNLLKRSRAHRWFELLVYQEGCKGESLKGLHELAYDVQQQSYRYHAPCDGVLRLHVNDAWGFYGNNSGFSSIRLTRLN